MLPHPPSGRRSGSSRQQQARAPSFSCRSPLRPRTDRHGRGSCSQVPVSDMVTGLHGPHIVKGHNERDPSGHGSHSDHRALLIAMSNSVRSDQTSVHDLPYLFLDSHRRQRRFHDPDTVRFLPAPGPDIPAARAREMQSSSFSNRASASSPRLLFLPRARARPAAASISRRTVRSGRIPAVTIRSSALDHVNVQPSPVSLVGERGIRKPVAQHDCAACKRGTG